MFGSQGGLGGLPFGAGASATATPADTRPPEERFQLQLQVRRSHSLRLTVPCICMLIALCRHHLATARHGLYKRIAECESAVGYRWKRARRDRVHPERRRTVGMSSLSFCVHVHVSAQCESAISHTS